MYLYIDGSFLMLCFLVIGCFTCVLSTADCVFPARNASVGPKPISSFQYTHTRTHRRILIWHNVVIIINAVCYFYLPLLPHLYMCVYVYVPWVTLIKLEVSGPPATIILHPFLRVILFVV